MNRPRTAAAAAAPICLALLAAAAVPGCRRSDAAAMPARTAPAPVPVPASTAGPVPGQAPRAAATPPPAEAVAFGAFRLHATEGTAFRRSDGRWIARATVAVTNTANTAQSLARMDFAALEGMTPWPAATTVPEGDVPPGETVHGDVAFVSAATPDAPAQLHLVLINATASTTGYLAVPLAPGAPRRPVDAQLAPLPGFFNGLRAAASGGAGTTPSAAPAAAAFTLAINEAGTFQQSPGGPWIVRVVLSVQNNSGATVQFNRALLAAVGPGGPLSNADVLALAHAHDVGDYVHDLQTRAAVCQQGNYYYSPLPQLVVLAPGQSTPTSYACFEIAAGPLAKLDVRYAQPGAESPGQSVLVNAIDVAGGAVPSVNEGVAIE